MAVVEVGLGGRLDATNATDPFVSVITSISYDHTAILGSTLGAIAGEKAGILRRATAGVSGRATAGGHDARCDGRAAASGHAARWCRHSRTTLPLAGAHQRQNARAGRRRRAGDDRAMSTTRRLSWAGAGALAGALRGRRGEPTDGAGRRAQRRFGRGAGRDAAGVCGGTADRAGGRHQSRQGRPGGAQAAAAPGQHACGRPRRATIRGRWMPAQLGRLCRALGADVHVQADLAAALSGARRRARAMQA